MKLLFDENLSPRLVELLAADFPGCTHIEFLGMRGAEDTAVWNSRSRAKAAASNSGALDLTDDSRARTWFAKSGSEIAGLD